MNATGIAYILWLPPLGLLGVHRFYCGRVGTGLLWLFTGGLVGLGWLIDMFLIPSMVREENARVISRLREQGPLGLMPANHGSAGPPPQPGSLQYDHRVIYCVRCGAAMQVPLEAVGRQYGCPHCRAVLVVPA
ncbi:MAG: NINE protein [bacterium]|nr:NINE protein [bacterium]